MQTAFFNVRYCNKHPQLRHAAPQLNLPHRNLDMQHRSQLNLPPSSLDMQHRSQLNLPPSNLDMQHRSQLNLPPSNSRHAAQITAQSASQQLRHAAPQLNLPHRNLDMQHRSQLNLPPSSLDMQHRSQLNLPPSGGRTETLIVLSTSLPVLVADFGRREGC